MPQRNITMTAATLGNVQGAQIERDENGAIRIRMDVVDPLSPLRDVRTILLSATSLTAAERNAWVAGWQIILDDLIAQPPAYT